jgi:hypothetical protein
MILGIPYLYTQKQCYRIQPKMTAKAKPVLE